MLALSMLHLLARLRRDDSGQANTEYALIVVVVLAIFAALLTLTKTSAPHVFQSLWDRLVLAIKA
jgi:Flp pilus assembly pilin Flp